LIANGCKFSIDDYVFVSNENSVDSNKEQEWVSRILEIRASDERHVYARVCWVYWPDELPKGTV
ncbi:hypothetical protein F5883DRAFT_373863, partial [Diaporthe sp. PMI_573]